MSYKFSVIIPLYNKRDEIESTISSVLAQTYPPHEIVVVDDGSTDGCCDIVTAIGSPLIKLVHQKNAGECAARNRAIAESTGDYIALIDADDTWRPEYLEKIATLIKKYPNCGIYSAGINLVTNGKSHPANNPDTEGVIDDYFKLALKKYICSASSSTIKKEVFDTVGGFPDGMKLGGDQFMWLKIVCAGYKVCFTPEKLCNYLLSASNRSSAIYIPERTEFSFRDYYKEGDFYRNEYIAKIEITKALTLSAKGCTTEAKSAEKFYSYTKLYRFGLWKLRILNRLPPKLRQHALGFYNRIAWLIAKKGF